MKKTLTIVTLLAGAVSGYSQGQINFYDYGTGLKQQIFNVQLTAPVNGTQVSETYNGDTIMEYQGSTAATAETPKGTTVYNGAGLSGASFDAQMLASTVPNDTLADLTAQGTIIHFFTQSAAAGYASGTVTETFASGTTATIAIAAWAVNSGGALGAATTFAQAVADTATGDAGYAWGVSTLANDTMATGSETLPTMPTTIEGFSLGQAVPEPSTIALGVIGASTLLFRRRK